MADPQPDEHFRTEHLAGKLRDLSVRGGLSIMSVQSAQFALNLASTAILARILTPGDFGLVSMAAAVASFLMLFLDMGLGSAIVQYAALTRSQVSTIFWINGALGLALAGVMAGIAPLVARFYGQPALVGVTVALAATFVISGLSVQHSALLRRQMRFSALSAIEVVSSVCGVITAVATAVTGAGYWALVYQQIVQQGASAVGAWMVCDWRPGPPARSPGIRRMVSFGAGLTRFNILTFLSRNLDNVIIGRVAGDAALGLYLKAYSLLMLPVGRIRAPASAVVVSALSHLQGDDVRFRRYYLRAITSVVAVGMPAVVFLFVFAEDAILLILGPQWRDSILLFKVLAPAAFVETFNTIGSWACLPLGKSARLVRWQTFATAVTVAAFLIGVQWGALGVAAAFSITTIVLRAPAIWYLLQGSPVAPLDLVRALARPAATSLLAGVAVFALRAMLSPLVGRIELLLAGAAVFGPVYLACWLVMPRGRQTLKELLGKRWPRWARAA
jgi:O-antigen/teichoic acid export membrane protein